MRQLIESLSPQAQEISWKRIFGVFALYVAMMVTAAGMMIAHQSAKKPTPESAAATTVRAKQHPASAGEVPLGHMATSR